MRNIANEAEIEIKEGYRDDSRHDFHRVSTPFKASLLLADNFRKARRYEVRISCLCRGALPRLRIPCPTHGQGYSWPLADRRG